MEFWSAVPSGNGFALFSARHLIWLGVLALAAAALCAAYRRGDVKRRRAMETGTGSALLAIELARVTVLTVQGQMNIGWLPLHLCGLSIFIEAWYVFSRRRPEPFGDFLYSTCMPGAFLALLTPD